MIGGETREPEITHVRRVLRGSKAALLPGLVHKLVSLLEHANVAAPSSRLEKHTHAPAGPRHECKRFAGARSCMRRT